MYGTMRKSKIRCTRLSQQKLWLVRGLIRWLYETQVTSKREGVARRVFSEESRMCLYMLATSLKMIYLFEYMSCNLYPAPLSIQEAPGSAPSTFYVADILVGVSSSGFPPIAQAGLQPPPTLGKPGDTCDTVLPTLCIPVLMS
jgi:hypothetical protein